MGIAYRVIATTIERRHGFLGAYPRVTSGLLLLTVALALTVAAGCGGRPAPDAVPDAGQVRGLVVEVVGRSISEVDRLRIRDEARTDWTFVGDDGFIGFTPSHLREHQLLGQTVLVTYESRGDSLVAVDLSD